ncbi:hypothetical protein ACE01N_19910 [Saccharicrinis sp. FJH2]|uniref:hypothetical protein n=1 Tax=Saccharicrinis sp. FJH65 TaxID=3344659 RepID=UPI0035F342E8
MKKIITTILIILIIHSCVDKKIPTYDLNGLNTFLGKEKSESLNETVSSFDSFLKMNFPEDSDFNSRAKSFLNYIIKNKTADNSWIIDTVETVKIFDNLEASGMRKEIFLYGYEEKNYKMTCNAYYLLLHHESLDNDKLFQENLEIPTINEGNMSSTDSIINIENEDDTDFDSLVSFNIRGEFLHGLLKFSKNDTLIDQYADAIYCAEDFSWPFIAKVYYDIFPNLENSFYKRMLVGDFYIYMINTKNK